MEQLELQTDLEIREKSNRKIFYGFLVFFAVVFLTAGSFWLGYASGESSTKNSGLEKIPLTQASISGKLPGNAGIQDLDFSLFWKVWNLVKEKHVDRGSLDATQMLYGAIRGMLKATGDPYTSFFDPKESSEFSQELEGTFQGIGAELGVKDEILTVIAPLSGSPAEKAGLRAGDKILKIGDKITTDLTIDQAVDLIRGKKGTEIRLTILHRGDQATQEVSIIRDTIEVKSVKFEMRANGFAYIKINKFGEQTTQEFSAAANSAISADAKGILLDLRNNPGGLLEKAVDIASVMIPKGRVVVSEQDSNGRKNNLHTKGGDRLSSIPTVVLIDEGSASASEILAAALRDNLGTKLIGKKSFGKGSVQELIPLPGGSSVKVTVDKWLTPNGDYIMEKGIQPDIEVELTKEDFDNDRDPQLDKALGVLKESASISTEK